MVDKVQRENYGFESFKVVIAESSRIKMKVIYLIARIHRKKA